MKKKKTKMKVKIKMILKNKIIFGFINNSEKIKVNKRKLSLGKYFNF